MGRSLSAFSFGTISYRQSSVKKAGLVVVAGRIEHAIAGEELHTYDLQTEDGAGFWADDVAVLLKKDPIDSNPIP